MLDKVIVDESQHFHIDLDDIVPEYYSANKYIRKIFFKRFEIAISYLRHINAKTVLDAGCGNGIFTHRIASSGDFNSVIGVDLNIHLEELGKKYKNVTFIRCDLRQLPFKKQFDAVVCLDVLEHFKDIDEVIKSVIRILKDDGYLIVSGPIEGFWYKLGRLIYKGTFSGETGPAAGRHYYNIRKIDKIIRTYLRFIRNTKIRFLFAHLFDVNLYRKSDNPIA